MKQSRTASLIESLLNTASGFFISLGAQWLFLPLIGVAISFHQNLVFAVFMTFVSIARSYGWRRLMEKLHIRTPLSPSVLAIAAERRRQREVEGYDDTHDDEHNVGELAAAGAVYALAAGEHRATPPIDWPWDDIYWKPQDMRRDLVRAGALIVAELDGLERRRRRRNKKTMVKSGVVASA